MQLEPITGGPFAMAMLRTEEIGDIVVVTFNQNRILDGQQVERTGKELLHLPTKAVAGKLLLDAENLRHLGQGARGV